MPNNIINAVHEETGIDESELEQIWQAAIKTAESKKIKNKDAYANAALQHVRKNAGKALDASARYIDDNKNLIAPHSVITGADVANYFGFEIPRGDSLGLDPKKLYAVYRPIKEIQDNDFNGKFLLSQHVNDLDSTTREKHQDLIIGTVYDCIQVGDDIKGTVAFQDAKAIDDLDSGKKYLSAGYWYDPVVEKGTYKGRPYDIKMTNIRANHVAHVDNPRLKRAIVGDNDSTNQGASTMLKNKYPALAKQFSRIGMDEDVTEKALTAMDEEDAKKAEEAAAKKAEDEDAEEAKKKAEDEEKEAELKKAQDELTSLKAGKPAMDSDAVQAMIDKKLEARMERFKTQYTAESKAMDSACQAYTQLFGEPNRMAFDSADGVYNAILSHSGIDHKGKSMEYKQGIVDALITKNKPQTAPTLDSNSLFGVSPSVAAFLTGVK